MSRTFAPSSIRLKAEPHSSHGDAKPDTTTVCLAFPLHNLAPAHVRLGAVPGPQRVYAYLPVGHYGWKFMVQVCVFQGEVHARVCVCACAFLPVDH